MTTREKTDNNDKQTHQQQILFAESELINRQFDQQSKAADDGKQILFSNQDYLPIEEQVDSEISSITLETLNHKEKKKPRWLWRIALSLLAVVIGVQTVDFFINGFVNSPITTSIYAVILGCLAIIASSALLSELITLRQFKRRDHLKQQAQSVLALTSTELTETKHNINVKDFCQKITDNLPCDLGHEQERIWQEAVDSGYSEPELLQLYSRVVLSKVDEKAMREVAKFSTESVVLVALSPVAIIDMLVMLWRNLRMINKVAGLYGLKLGYWSRIKLIKQVFVNMVYAGASELITDFGTDMIGADLLGKLSGRLAQGLGAGMLTARLGVKTMQLCRPIPFEEKPKLNHVRKEMLTTIKKLL